MPTLTVPKPLTSNVPSFSSTPYNQANAAFNANQNAFGQFGSNVPTPQQLFTGQPIPEGTILSQYSNFNPMQGTGQQASKPAAPTPSPWYTPPNVNRVKQDLSQLIAGWSINPNTGQTLSPAQMLGKAGGSSIDSFLAHKGVIDPASAQQALSQYKSLVASGKPMPNINDRSWYDNLNAPVPAPASLIPQGWANAGGGTPAPTASPGGPMFAQGYIPSSTPGQTPFLGYGQPQAQQIAAQQAAVPANMTVSTKNYRNY